MSAILKAKRGKLTRDISIARKSSQRSHITDFVRSCNSQKEEVDLEEPWLHMCHKSGIQHAQVELQLAQGVIQVGGGRLLFGGLIQKFSKGRKRIEVPSLFQKKNCGLQIFLKIGVTLITWACYLSCHIKI